MSPVKNKEDTWKANELEKHIRTMKDDKGTASRSKRQEDDKDRQGKRHRDDSVKKHRDEGDRRNRDDKERRPRDDKERRPRDDEERRPRDDKERRPRDDEERRPRDDKERRPRDDRERRPHDDSDRKHRDDEKRHRDDRERRPPDDSDRRRRDGEKRHRDENDREKTKSSRTKEEGRGLEKTSSSKHRDEDDDERRRRREERKRREAEEEGGGDRDHRRHREKDDNRDTDGKRHRDRDDDKKRERHGTRQEEQESKSRNKDEKERSKEDDPERRHRRHKEERDVRDRGDSESRHKKQRDKYKDEEERAGQDDRDSRKHRREKEAAAGEDVDRDRRRGRSEKPEKEERRKKQPEPERAKTYDEYEDDFEAYEDDFDARASDNSDASDHYEAKKPKSTRKPKPALDVNSGSGSARSAEGGKEMDDILRALDEENRRLLSSSPIVNKEEDRRQSKKKESLPPADRPTFINFVSAKQRTVTGKTSKKIRTRANDLLNLIEFDTVSFTLFEQHSEKEYDRFIRSFGRMNAMQAYVQTNDDNLDQEIQTEEIELHEKWSQHPPEAGIPPCGGDSDPSSSAEFGQLIYKVPWDAALEKGIRVIETLLEENNMEYMHKNVGHKQSNIVVSEAFVELASVPILKGRHVISSQFSPDQNHLLLAAYSRRDKDSEESNPLQTKGIVCVWNVYEPSRPQKILVCPSQPMCGCFSPVKSTLVFAGLEDGVIVTWDLREPDSLHKRVIHENVEYVLRHPTYNTAMPYLHDSHSSPVIRLAPIVSNASKSSVSGSATAEECLSYQLASLEQNSVIVLWVVVELDRPDPVGSTSDFGLREGGRVKLVKSSVIKLESPRSVRNSVLDTTFESTDLQVWPKDNSQYIIATASTGCILHATRHGGHISPKAFRPTSDYPFDVTSIDFSPFLSSIFLAGGSDGSIRLFRVDLSHALMTWRDATDGRSIRMVRWCRSRPSVFFVLDEDSFIYIWDLHMDDNCALKKEQIAKSRVTSICLSNDHSATGQGLPDRPPQMAVFLETGVAEAHIIKKEFSALMPDEIRQFSGFINKAIL